MRIVVIGEGKVGFTLTRELSREGHDLLVIDNRKDALVQVEERLDVMVLEGNGASVKVQQAAEVGKCDLMIAVTSADETNLLCCMVARKLGWAAPTPSPAFATRFTPRKPIFCGKNWD